MRGIESEGDVQRCFHPSNRGLKMSRLYLFLICLLLPTSGSFADQLPSFAKGTPYSTARSSLLQQGWEPYRMPDAGPCSTGERECHVFPEVWACGSGAGGRAGCSLTWRRGGVTLEISADGEFPNLRVSKVRCYAGCPQADQRRVNIEEYSALNRQGNIAAQQGQFAEAINSWQRAVPLDPSRVVNCRGEFLRVRIKAAQEAMEMVQGGRLARSQASKWFEDRSTQLWMPNRCNTP